MTTRSRLVREAGNGDSVSDAAVRYYSDKEAFFCDSRPRMSALSRNHVILSCKSVPRTNPVICINYL